MKYIFYCAILFLFSCSSSVQQENQKTTDTTVTTMVQKDSSSEKSNQVKSIPAERTVYYYNGLIGGKYSIEVSLSEFGDSVKGQYRYTSQSDYLTLKGDIREGNYIIKEFDPFGKNTGSFSGKKNDNNELTGEWTNGKRTFSFVFVPKINEEFTGDVTLITKEYQAKDGNCPCATILFPFVTKASSTIIKDSLNKNLNVESFAGDKNYICYCQNGYSYGLTYGSFDVLYNKNNILSIQWCGETVAAYPDGFCIYKNLDTRTGSLIASLSEIYKEEGIAYIISKVEETINQRLAELREDEEVEEDAKDWLNDLAAPREMTKEDIKDFSFSDKGISVRNLIDFPHAIQCYQPDGDVFIPYSELDKWRKE